MQYACYTCTRYPYMCINVKIVKNFLAYFVHGVGENMYSILLIFKINAQIPKLTHISLQCENYP